MFSGNGIGIEPVIFKESTNQINSVKVEYHVDGKRVQFHLWGDPEFPNNLEESLLKGLKQFPKDTVVVEFVPEVNSWYVEVNNLAVRPTDVLVESLVKKMATSVNKNG